MRGGPAGCTGPLRVLALKAQQPGKPRSPARTKVVGHCGWKRPGLPPGGSKQLLSSTCFYTVGILKFSSSHWCVQTLKAENIKLPQHIPNAAPGHGRVSLVGNSTSKLVFTENGDILELGDLTRFSFSLPGHQLVPLERPRVLHPLRRNEDAPLQPPPHGGEEAAGPALLSRAAAGQPTFAVCVCIS